MEQLKELFSRYEILLENYSKALHIESLTLQEMVRKDFSDGLVSYTKDLTKELSLKKSLLPDASGSLEEATLSELDSHAADILKKLQKLTADTKAAEDMEDTLECAKYYAYTVLADMNDLRISVDAAESLIPERYLPYPTYDEILYSLR